MSDQLRIEGFAIVSANGMLAADNGIMPNSLKFDVDQDFLSRSLDGASLLVHGAKSHEGHDNSHNRKRLLLTRGVGAFSTTPRERNVWMWNPRATPFDEAREALGVHSGVVAILGGPGVYEMFLPRYDAFHLVRALKVFLPDGMPVFGPCEHGLTPEATLRGHGLGLRREEVLDESHSLVQQHWVRES